jgi:hypothetical protein
VQGEMLGICVPWRNGASGATCREQVLVFLPSVGVFLLFGRGARALLLSRTVGNAGPPCSFLGETSGTKK